MIRKATQAEPGWRFQTAQEMLDALAERKTGAWDGAPVQPGDLLNQSYELVEPGGIVEGVYVFSGTEIATETPVSIAVAPRSAEFRERLLVAVSALQPEVRSVLGTPRLLRTADDITFAVLDGDDSRDAVRMLMGVRVAPAPDHEALFESFLAESLGDRLLSAASEIARDAVKESGDWFKGMLPVVAAGLVSGVMSGPKDVASLAPSVTAKPEPRPWISAVHTAFIRVDAVREHVAPERHLVSLAAAFEIVLALVLVCRAVANAEHPDAPGRDSLGSLLRRARACGLLDGVPEVVSVLESLVATRNLVAHGASDSLVLAEDDLEAARACAEPLLDIANRVSQSIAAAKLEPLVKEMSDGTWALLMLHGSAARYVALDGSQHDYPPDARALNWLAMDIGAAARGSIGSARSQLLRQRSQLIRDLMGKKAYCGKLVQNPQARSGSYVAESEFLVLSPAGESVLIVESVMTASVRSREAQRDRRRGELWLNAMAFEVPYLLVTDGECRLYYSVDSNEGLVLLSDDERIVEQFGRRRS